MLWLVRFHHQVFYFNFSYWFVTTTRYCSFLVFLLIVIPVCQFMQSITIMTVILFSMVHSNLDYVNQVYSVTKTDYIKIINEYVRWQKITFSSQAGFFFNFYRWIHLVYRLSVFICLFSEVLCNMIIYIIRDIMKQN